MTKLKVSGFLTLIFHSIYVLKASICNYKPCDGGKVIMGNNYICKVSKTCTIRLQMFDSIIRELQDVRHISDLKRDFILVGVLDQTSCLVIVESSVLKVIKGSMILMKGDMNKGLYMLRGTAITKDVSVKIRIE